LIIDKKQQLGTTFYARTHTHLRAHIYLFTMSYPKSNPYLILTIPPSLDDGHYRIYSNYGEISFWFH